MSVADLLKMPDDMKTACVEAAVMDGEMGKADVKLEDVRARLRAMNSANPRS